MLDLSLSKIDLDNETYRCHLFVVVLKCFNQMSDLWLEIGVGVVVVNEKETKKSRPRLGSLK